MTEKEEQRRIKINKGSRKIAPTGTIMEEKWLAVEGENMEEVEKAFDKRWEK